MNNVDVNLCVAVCDHIARLIYAHDCLAEYLKKKKKRKGKKEFHVYTSRREERVFCRKKTFDSLAVEPLGSVIQ